MLAAAVGALYLNHLDRVGFGNAFYSGATWAGTRSAKAWLFGGNTVLRVGVVLLFLGLAFLLRYATEGVEVPVELRYMGVAASALALPRSSLSTSV